MRTFPSLTSLTPDERVWRLDWFGECAYPGSVRARTHPSIKVAISPLCCEPDDSDALLLPGCTDHSNQREIWLPITALPLLKIGDLWQDGHLIASPGYRVETFRNVRIEPGNTSFIKAGLAIDGKFPGVRQLRSQAIVFYRAHFKKCHYNSANCSGAAGFSIPNA